MGESAKSRRPSLIDILSAPVGCLLQASSPLVVVLLAAVALLAGSYVYFNTNINPFGIGAPDFSAYQISNTFERVSIDGRNWTIQYERAGDNAYKGLVRHISPIRMSKFPFLTHDILITTGDFANAELVKTRVFNHQFTWSSSEKESPAGTINLLHAVPVNEAVYRQLMQIQNGKHVRITGREIYHIDLLSSDGNIEQWWQDQGCNSILVRSVSILDN
jgi:hypothetical protein